MQSGDLIKVVVVHDSVQERSLLRVLLVQVCPVRLVGEFRDGAEALARLPAVQPDIVFSNIVRLGLSGFELARRLKRRRPRTQIVFVTGLTDPAAIEAASEAGVAAYLLNPLSRDKLGAAIQAAKSGTFYLSDASLSRGADNPFLDPALAFPVFLTPHAHRLWAPSKGEVSFWPALAQRAGHRPRACARLYRRSLRQTEDDWPVLFGTSLRTWFDGLQVSGMKQEIAEHEEGELEHLGATVNLKSPRHARAKFKHVTGQTPRQFRDSIFGPGAAPAAPP